MTVDPHGAVHIDTVELNGVAFLLVEGLHIEGFPIPAQSGRKEADASSTRIVAKVFSLDAPVVRNIELAPVTVAESRHLGISHIAQVESPPGIHTSHPAGLRHNGSCREQREYAYNGQSFHVHRLICKSLILFICQPSPA